MAIIKRERDLYAKRRDGVREQLHKGCRQHRKKHKGPKQLTQTTNEREREKEAKEKVDKGGKVEKKLSYFF